MIAAAASTFEMMPSVLSTGLESLHKRWRPLQIRGHLLRLATSVLPASVLGSFAAAKIDIAAQEIVSHALWFDGAREWLNREDATCDAATLDTIRRLQRLLSTVRGALGPTVVLAKQYEQQPSASADKFRVAIGHFESAVQQLLVSLTDLQSVLVDQCLRAGLLSEATALELVGSPHYAACLRRISEGSRQLRNGSYRTTQVDEDLLAEARKTLEAIEK